MDMLSSVDEGEEQIVMMAPAKETIDLTLAVNYAPAVFCVMRLMLFLFTTFTINPGFKQI